MIGKLLRAGVLSAFGMFIIGIIGGCGDDEPTADGEIKLLATVPEDGGTIAATGELKMVFDGFPGTVTVDGKEAKIMEDNTATVKIADLLNPRTGPESTFIVSWTNLDNSFFGTQTLSFTVIKRATTVVVQPPVGSLVQKGGDEFTLKFDEEVLAASLSGTPANGSGFDWKVWVSNLPYGSVSVAVEWINQDGSAGTMEVGPYEVADICFSPAAITSGTVADGDADVDPAPINAGGFRFDFDEGVTGTIKLTDEAGADLNWIDTVAGKTATLTAVAGQELVNETTYKIEIDVADGADNPLQTTITFVTKPK